MERFSCEGLKAKLIPSSNHFTKFHMHPTGTLWNKKTCIPLSTQNLHDLCANINIGPQLLLHPGRGNLCASIPRGGGGGRGNTQ